MASTSRVGELDAFDPSFLERHGPWMQQAVRTYFRSECFGLERLPKAPFLGVGNHSGAVMIPDTFVWLAHYFSTAPQKWMLTLAHDAMFDVYPAKLARALAKLGGIRAGPGVAHEALRRGHPVMVYPGGDFDACRSFARRNEIVFAGRKGYVALAREAKVPIVPIVSIGGHETLFILNDGTRLARLLGLDKRFRLRALPLSLSLPWGLWLGPMPGFLPLPAKIDCEVLEPVDPSGDAATVDLEVRTRMQRALDALAARRRRWPG